jgi:hypothetical protein
VAAEKFGLEAKTDPAAHFAVGHLTAHREATTREARKALRRAGTGGSFWIEARGSGSRMRAPRPLGPRSSAWSARTPPGSNVQGRLVMHAPELSLQSCNRSTIQCGRPIDRPGHRTGTPGNTQSIS